MELVTNIQQTSLLVILVCYLFINAAQDENEPNDAIKSAVVIVFLLGSIITIITTLIKIWN